jgi:Fe-S-cluster containining protein
MSKISLQLSKKNARSCDGCTKCCEGYLSATIYGEDMYRGKPCQFVDLGTGCTIYKKRPEDPCKTFQCVWRAADFVPEEFSPKSQQVLVTEQKINGIPYLSAIPAGKEISTEMLSWFVSYGVGRQLNVEWVVEDRPYHLGQVDFIHAMSQRYSISS